MPPATGPEQTSAPGSESKWLGFREAMRLARDEAARTYLVRLLLEVRGEVAQAARLAGIERESLHRLLRKLGISAADFRSRSRDNGE
jgi:transcriptional regulator of acetoin/glycerol metabolism